MLLPPLAPTVADHLGVLGIAGDPPAMIVSAPPPLALRLTIDVCCEGTWRVGTSDANTGSSAAKHFPKSVWNGWNGPFEEIRI
jgi:hypothetical protein